jgi:hypothetical protein
VGGPPYTTHLEPVCSEQLLLLLLLQECVHQVLALALKLILL